MPEVLGNGMWSIQFGVQGEDEERGDGLKDSPSGEVNECPVYPYLYRFWKHAVPFLDFSLVNQRN